MYRSTRQYNTKNAVSACGRAIAALACALGLTITTHADQGSSATGANEIIVTLLGTGTPVPNRRQQGPSVLVEAAGERLLFDCGRGCASQLWNADHDHLKKTRHLFLTHMHSDHTIGIGDLFMNGWNLGRSDTLEVFGPPGAQTLLQHIRAAFEEDVRIRADEQIHSVTRDGLSYKTTPVQDGTRIELGPVTVTVFDVDHHVVKPAFGYRVDYGERSVVISGDTAYSENLIRYSKGADVLIHEVMSGSLEHFIRSEYPKDVADDIVALHTLAPDVGRVFAKTNTRLGVLTHLNNDPRAIPSLQEEIRSTFDGEFVVGKDLLQIIVGEEIRLVEFDD